MAEVWNALKDWLSKRRTRASYLRYNVGLLLTLVPLGILVALTDQDWLRDAIILFICLLEVAAAIQRCHDIGWIGWIAPLTLVPLLGTILWLALFFIPGTRGPNRYGPDPREFQASIAVEPTVWKQ